jgi:hypothetical protein
MSAEQTYLAVVSVPLHGLASVVYSQVEKVLKGLPKLFYPLSLLGRSIRKKLY